jgi:hypothetical protein
MHDDMAAVSGSDQNIQITDSFSGAAVIVISIASILSDSRVGGDETQVAQ